MPRTHLFYSWKFASFDPLSPLSPPSCPPSHPPLWPPPICSSELGAQFFVFFFDSTHKRDHLVFAFPCLMYFMVEGVVKVHPCCHTWQDLTLFTAEEYSGVYERTPPPTLLTQTYSLTIDLWIDI